LRQGHDIVVIVRGTTVELTGLDVALASLERIAKRAGLYGPTAISNQPLETGDTTSGAKQQSGIAIAIVNREEPSKGDEPQKLSADG
jgi:hypothetical protein